MSEPPTPSTPDSPLPLSPQAPPGPQFLPAGESASPTGAEAGDIQGLAGSARDPQPYPAVTGADPGPAPEGQRHDDVPSAPENVGRGLAFSLLAVVLGAVLAGLIYQMGFIASITSFAMAFAAVWLYAKGAGAPPRAGTWPLIGVIVVGVVISLFTMVGWRLYAELSAQHPAATAGDLVPYVFELLFDPEVWSYVGTDALIFVGFAGLGTFTTLRQLRGSTEAQA